MIKSLADILEKIKLAEQEKIDATGIKHRSTIGNMYESLTKSLLEKVVFDGLNLNVLKNSFIRLEDGTRSKELDILLIEGEGQKLPQVEQYDVALNQVIAVIQVKKTLNRDQIEDAYRNLKDVYDLSDSVHPCIVSQRELCIPRRRTIDTYAMLLLSSTSILLYLGQIQISLQSFRQSISKSCRFAGFLKDSGALFL